MPQFDYFVVFAAMRTGSNFLEENLNDYPSLKCWGEVFNPHFIGHANTKELLGIDLQAREADPMRLIAKLKAETKGLPGFRFFPGHDPRVMAAALKDPRCAKVILTRNPIESYVSHRIAAATGQWRLGDLKHAKSAKATFEKAGFDAMLAELQGFQIALLRGLQTSGQTGFYIGYDDIQNLDVLNGLAAYLGDDAAKDTTNTKTKVQNPAALRDKVENFDEMVSALSDIDHFNLNRTPNFEPRRGASVPKYLAAAHAPLLYMPLQGGPEDAVAAWLAALGDGPLKGGFNQKLLRQWKRQNAGHRSFTVLRHPVARLHAVFCKHILMPGPDCYEEIRETLRSNYKLRLPDAAPDNTYDLAQHRAAFAGFAEFVKGNLGGQTSVRVDPAWASQTEVLAGFAAFGIPDRVIREEDMGAELQQLAASVGAPATDVPAPAPDAPFTLEQVYDEEIEAIVKGAYQRDYMMFGYRPWGKK